MGCVSAAGVDLKENMETLFRGIQNTTPPRTFSTDHSLVYPVFEVSPKAKLLGQDHGDIDDSSDFNHIECLNQPHISKVDHTSTVNHVSAHPNFAHLNHGQFPPITRTTALVLRAVEQAVNDAGLSMDNFKGKRVGVCMGTTVGCSLNSIEFYKSFREGGFPDILPVQRYLESNPAACTAERYNLMGPVQTVANACASGTDALGIALSWIENGLCDIVIAGGGDELCRVTYNGFISLMITDPAPCKPFDAQRKGLNLGEGAGIMVLESPGHAEKRSARPHGYLCGYGTACDAFHLVSPDPSGAGLEKALTQAMYFSSTAHSDMAFINAHGTGTQDNDRVESTLMPRVFPEVPFFSTKGCTGHTLGAAGAIEAVYTVSCLNSKIIPASIGFKEKDPDLPGIPVSSSLSIEGRYAVSQSLAFGGNNSALVIAGKEGV